MDEGDCSCRKKDGERYSAGHIFCFLKNSVVNVGIVISVVIVVIVIGVVEVVVVEVFVGAILLIEKCFLKFGKILLLRE